MFDFLGYVLVAYCVFVFSMVLDLVILYEYDCILCIFVNGMGFVLVYEVFDRGKEVKVFLNFVSDYFELQVEGIMIW